jgi:monomeric phenylalanine-4-hydroxylase
MLAAGSASVMVAGGMESMTNAPHLMFARKGVKYGAATMYDHMAMDGLEDAYERGKAMGVFAEQCVAKYAFTREAMDQYSITSTQRARTANEDGNFGWEIAPVPGLIPDDVFFGHLANRRFPSSFWIRKPEEIDYLVEPDVFHDVFGHVPLLFDPVFADYLQHYGTGGPKAIEHDAVSILARLYWYMVEFGLIQTEDGLKAYGAGMLSSFGETQFSIDSPGPNRIGFDLERVMRTRYEIDAFQSTYFVLPSFEKLFRDSIDTDFGPLYEKLMALEPYAPGDVVAGDTVLHRGAGV